MQIMISQYSHNGSIIVPHPAQHLQRLRTTVDKITDKPETIRTGAVPNRREQALKGPVTAVDVADDVSRQDAATLLNRSERTREAGPVHAPSFAGRAGPGGGPPL